MRKSGSYGLSGYRGLLNEGVRTDTIVIDFSRHSI